MNISEEFCNTLNEAFALDPNAIYCLQITHTPCNQALADHKTIIVREVKQLTGEPKFTVGFVGLLNGLLEAAGQHKIATMWTDIEPFQLLGFTVLNEETK